MLYYLQISSDGFPIIFYTENEPQITDYNGRFCVVLERTEAIIISRVIKRYIDKCIQEWDGDAAFQSIPYAIPKSYILKDGLADVERIRSDLRIGKIKLVDNFIFK